MSGTLMFFPTPLSMSNASGDGSGTICGGGGAFAGDAILKPPGGGSRGTGVEDFGGDLFMIAVGRGGGDKVLRVDNIPVCGVGEMSEGGPEGGPGRGLASNKIGAGSESLLEVPACGDGNSEEVFPDGAGGDGKLKLSSVGVNPK
jgi:hypothetical protein